MTLADKALSAVATGRTFVGAFLGPCLWIGISAAVIGAGISGYGTFKVTRAFYQREALEARLQLAQFKEALATATATGEANAAARQVEALAAIRDRETATSEAVAAIPGQVAALLAPKFTALRESLHAPQYDCLRVPLPADALQLLERPGGIAPADR